MLPEEYESVTVLFSAVQDFSATAAACSPTQLMGMMHILYTTIDAGISKFDVYKVETVIDQYLVGISDLLTPEINHYFVSVYL